MRGAVAGANAARHAAALSRPVRGGVGQLDAVAASQPAAMADGCVAQHVGQVAGKGRMLLVHNSMLKPSRSIKMLTLIHAVGCSGATGRRQAARSAPQELLQGLLCEIIVPMIDALLLLFMALMVALLLLLLGWHR